jgi:hypothetical protein
MNAISFFATYVAQPVVENRFGLIPVGTSTVKIIDLKEIRASQNCRLSDDGKIVDITAKPTFPMEFDQNILIVVYQDSENRVIMDRRSSTGWLADGDKNDKKEPMVTPEIAQKYGMTLLNGKYVRPRKGWKVGSPESQLVGVENSFKTKSALSIVDKLCDACGVTNPMQILGKSLDIDVETDTYEGKDGREVRGYAKAGTGFKAKKIAPVASNVPTNPAIQNLPEDTADPDDLPF